MTSKLIIGDRLKLPSGDVVYIALAADPERPWRPRSAGSSWEVRREHGPGRAHQNAWQQYCGDKDGPLQLIESDATALAFALNRVRARR